MLHSMKKRLAVLAALSVATALAGCGKSGGQDHGAGGAGMPPAEVTVLTVAPRPLPITFEYVGQTTGSREVEVRARVTGILLKRNFVEGAAVKKGQSLVIVEAMKMEHTITAPSDGEIAAVNVNVGEQVNEKRELVRYKDAG